MAGIAGVFRPAGERVAEREVAELQRAIRHRGSEAAGMYVSGDVGLVRVHFGGEARFIGEASPFEDRHRKLVICHDGVLYNGPALRRELEASGVQLSKGGDAEVILAAIAEYGLGEALARLEGMWALAVWDTGEQILTLARDRHGAKPLFYRTSDKGEVSFASEMKALVEPGVLPDPASIHACLLGWGGTWGERTVFSGIRAVRAGERVRFSKGGAPDRSTYASLTDLADPGLYQELERESDQGILDRVEAELERSIIAQTGSDESPACLVSGGVDSTLIAGLALKRSPGIPLYHAEVASDSERNAAEAVALALKGQLNIVQVTDQDFLDHLAYTTFHNEVPLVYHPNSVPFSLVAQKAAADGNNVLLTGIGSDSYFLGSPFIVLRPFLERYQRAIDLLQGGIHRLVPRAARLLWPRRSADLAEQLRRLLFRFLDDTVAENADAALRFIPEGRARRSHKTTLVNIHQNLSTLLHRDDRLGEAAGIQPRYPFLWDGVGRLAVNLPGRHKIRLSRHFYNPRHPFVIDKWCVRQVAARYAPAYLAQRPKKGFPLRIYDRIRVDDELFRDGFVLDFFGLGSHALSVLQEEATPLWISHLMLLEIWGRMFIRATGVHAAADLVRRHVTFVQ